MKIDLAGEWTLALDPADRGQRERWYAAALAGPASLISLPGSLQEQGYGDDITLDTPWIGTIVDRQFFDDSRYAPYREPGAIKTPFWLQPEKYYAGAAWYQRTVRIPREWEGQRLTLTLERPHWETAAWLDDVPLGRCDSLATAHVYELGTHVAPGDHRLTIRVDNRMLIDVGPNAHSMSDHTQSNWNGIVGRLELAAESPIWLRTVRVFPDVARKHALVKIDMTSVLGKSASGTVRVTARLAGAPDAYELPPVSVPIGFSAAGGLSGLDLSAAGGHVDIDYPLGDDAQVWDEFNPALYELTVELEMVIRGEGRGARGEEEIVRDRRVVTFGLREIGTSGTQITLNNRPIFLRGTLECCIFPLTGYPPTDVESWKRIIRVCKAHGLNQIRFHSWCPPEAAFVAADELGFYYQVECPSWANQGAAIGEGRPLDEWLYREGWRLLAAYGNHPSFIMMAYGNEPAGRHVEFLAEWVTYWRKRDPRRVYTSGAGWPMIPENDYHNTPDPRIQRWGAGLASRINGQPPETTTDYREFVEQAGRPVVSHEIGQWCVYPNFAEIDKYTGVLKPKNFEIFRDFLEANHMGDQAHDFFMASGKLQALCYKEEVESALRTPGFGGFQLLDLHDFPGQGTALVGVLDPFWDEKGYITAEQFRRFCGPTVPLARLEKRIWHTGETLRAEIQVAHFGPAPLADATLDWALVGEDGRAARSGKRAGGTIAPASQEILGAIECDLADLPPAQKYSLVVSVEAGGERHENDWDVWVFAPSLAMSAAPDVLVSGNMEAALAHATGGGRALLLLDPARVQTTSQIGFSSVFWNTAWTRGQAPHTLGILCDPAHPIFAGFPTEGHSNWQWWELIHGAAAMQIDHLPPALRPLVQPIDTWFEARRLGLLFEAKVGDGALMVASMDLASDLDQRLVARQLRAGVLGYMQSDGFQPAHVVTADAVRKLMGK
ncbi:MAG: glycoside hydrolase [Caldilineaceae bacterium]|nr:glycoside hydrolase [Caldilineaceae bacterium]